MSRIACILFCAALALAAAGPLQAKEVDPVLALGSWIEDFKRNGPELDPDDVDRLDTLVADLRMVQIAEPDRRREVVLALLDLSGVLTTEEIRTQRKHSQDRTRVSRQTDRIRKYGRRALETILATDGDDELATWLATSVLVLKVHPTERRRAALELLAGRHRPATRLAIFGCALDEERDLREAAMAALIGWQDDGVHQFMLQQLERNRSTPGWVSRRTIQRHFGTLELDPASPGGRELFDFTRRAILSKDWRESYRAIQLHGAVADDPAVPSLIESLAVWVGRRERGQGSRRIESEILRELERRSGRRMGPHPERWATWWKVKSASRDGGEAPVEAPVQATRAGFFGLRPMTDRVVFVIDGSSSMTTPFGTEGNTRYGEAIDQMIAFLTELGEGTRFRIVLFSSRLQIWRDRLEPVNEASLRTAERWLRYRPPGGATFLKPGIEEVLRLDEYGRPDLSKIEEDTVIVLCDGATAEGAGWVAGLLGTANEEACLAFHSVQIGSGGDGTLQTLASISGGDFVHVIE